MQDFLTLRTLTPVSVDWRPPQARFFADLDMSLNQLARETGDAISASQLGRYASVAVPLPAYLLYPVARAARNDALSAYYARLAGKLIVDRPSTTEGTNMDVFLRMKKRVARIDELQYQRLLQGQLSAEEENEYRVLCERVAQDATSLWKTAPQEKQ